LFTEEECCCATRKDAVSGGKRTQDELGCKKDPNESEKFTGKHKDWQQRKREAIAFSSKKIGRAGVPLVYLLHADAGDEETADALDGIIESTLLYRIKIAPLSGEAFTLDNYELFQFLVSWTSSGTVEPHVDLHKGTQNGRLAWLRLEETYEGSDSPSRLYTQCTSKDMIITF
jgi:hypothetical protein